MNAEKIACFMLFYLLSLEEIITDSFMKYRMHMNEIGNFSGHGHSHSYSFMRRSHSLFINSIVCQSYKDVFTTLESTYLAK